MSTESGSRVLVFEIGIIFNGKPAAVLLGKPNFTDTVSPLVPTAQNFRSPTGLSYDATNGRLFVADPGFDRVLVFEVQTIFNNESATEVICQSNFSSQADGTSASGCSSPKGVAYDGSNNRLYVSDSYNHRVSAFFPAGLANISSGMSASAFLGQLAAPASTAGTSRKRLDTPNQIAVTSDGKLLYIADEENARIMLYDVSTPTTHEDALDMIGQYDESSYSPPHPKYDKSGEDNSPNLFGFGFSGSSVAIDSVRHRLFVSDSSNKRVLLYQLDTQNELLSKIPTAVLGQANFASSAAAVSQAGMSGPELLAYDSVNDRLFVSDYLNSRVLVFNTASVTSGQSAAFVLGQPNFTSGAAAVTQSGLSYPAGLAIDEANQRLFVADDSAGRVLVYDVSSVTNGENAIAVLGQTDFTSKVFAVSETRIMRPYGLAFDPDGQRLFVNDTGAHRILVFDVTTITNGEAAVGVLCQPSFTTANTGLSATRCNNPKGLAYSTSQKVLYVADFNNRRVLAYDVASVTNGEAATHVLGQTDFTSATDGTTAYTVSPYSVAVNELANKLYAGDLNPSRILIFPTHYSFTYSGSSFSESNNNNGSISATVAVAITGDSFSAGSGTLTRGVDYTISGVPAGLTEVITKNSSNTATISFTGAATAHASADSVPAITLAFLDAALQGVPASSVSGYTTNFSMNFKDPPCFRGKLRKPIVRVQGSSASVLLPAGIVPSAQCTITAIATSKKLKKTKSRSYRVGKQAAKISKLAKGSWTFGYVVTTKALGTAQTSQTRTGTIR